MTEEFIFQNSLGINNGKGFLDNLQGAYKVNVLHSYKDKS